MASAEVDSPKRHLGDRSPNEVPRSPRRDRGRDRRDGGDKYRPPPQERPAPPVKTEEEKQAIAKAEYEKLLTMRSGGTYIPPARLRALQAQITDKKSKEYQRLMWEALKKSLNGMINKVNSSNIKHIVPELVGENLIRGRGLYCRSIMKAQAASLPFTPVFAAMTAIINSKFPAVGQLLAKRLVMQFRKGFRRSDKSVCLSSTAFLAHLINTNVVHEMLAGQMLLLLLNKPTDDSVEIAVGFMKEVGQQLQDMQPAIATVIFDQFRNILHEADIDKRVQYMIEVLFQVRKDNFKDNPPIKEELDLVEDEDQITHRINLDGDNDVEDGLNVFKYDPNWEENEEKYQKLKREILGEGSDYEDDDDDDEDESSDEEETEEQKAMEIKDQSNTDLVNLRRTIYLTVMSSIDPEEATHKLMRINLPPGNEPELPSMIVEICSQEKTYTKYHGLIGERFAKLNRLWTDLFEKSFENYYSTIHRYETNRLRNIARFFAHMLASDAIGWHVLSAIHLNEEETTSSSRIFIKILFSDIAEEIGMAKLQERLKDEMLQPSLTGIFRQDTAKNVRFAINYFTSIGMGALTEGMREFLQNMPKPALPAPVAAESESDSDSVSSYSSYTGSSYSSRSRSRTPPRRAIDRARSDSRSPAPRRGRGRSYSRDRSSTRSLSRSVSPPPRRARRDSSYSASPPPRRSRRYSSESRSRTPSPPRQRARSRGRSETPPRHGARRNSSSISRSPPPRRGVRRGPSSASGSPRRRRQDIRSPSRASSYDSRSRSRSPVGRRTRDSPSPPPRSRNTNARRDSYSRSPSTPPRRQLPGGRGGYPDEGPRNRRQGSSSPVNGKRRRSSDSMSRSPSPPPMKRGRRGS